LVLNFVKSKLNLNGYMNNKLQLLRRSAQIGQVAHYPFQWINQYHTLTKINYREQIYSE